MQQRISGLLTTIYCRGIPMKRIPYILILLLIVLATSVSNAMAQGQQQSVNRNQVSSKDIRFLPMFLRRAKGRSFLTRLQR
jgi:hypothetical protein